MFEYVFAALAVCLFFIGLIFVVGLLTHDEYRDRKDEKKTKHEDPFFDKIEEFRNDFK